MAVRRRPKRVTGLAILKVISGVIIFVYGSLLMEILVEAGGFPLLASYVGVLAVALVLIGFGDFLIAYGFLKGGNWAWNAGLILSLLSVIIGFFALPTPYYIMKIIVDAVIIFYLYRPDVLEFFRKGLST